MKIQHHCFEKTLNSLIKTLRESHKSNHLIIKKSVVDQIIDEFKQSHHLELKWDYKSLLSFMETICLALIFLGKGTKQVAAILSISECTVTTYENRIRQKLKANNRQESVLAAIKKGYMNQRIE